MRTSIFLTATLLLAVLTVKAQDGWNWPDSPELRSTAEEKNVLYSDYLKQDNFTAAKKHLDWLLINVPNLNPSIYINGAKVYEGLIDVEKDQARLYMLQDSLMTLYGLRIKNFNDEATVVDRMAYSSYKYWRDRKEKSAQMFETFEKAFVLNGNKMSSYNFVGYMDAARRHKINNKSITDEKIIEIYENVSDAIDFQLAETRKEGGSTDRLEKIKETVDKLFAASVTITCDLIEKNLGAKYKANPTDIKLAKNIFKLGFASKCTDSDVFLQATEFYFTQAPEYGLARLIGIKYLQKESYDKAIGYYNKAADLTDENLKKAEIYMSIAEVNYKRGQKTSAREYALKAVNTDPSIAKDAYTLIGNMYYTSYEQCKSGENHPVKDRAVFIAAYEMFKKAGNTTAMAQAKEQFPSIEDIFNNNMEVGKVLQVGCWIGEAVTVQRRD